MKHLAFAAVAASLSGCCLTPSRGTASAPAPAPVAAAPAPAAAPADGDRDGVADGADRCPQSPAGSRVNSFGCPVGEKVTVELDVQFETSRAEVRPQYDGQLAKVADFLKAYPGSTAEIEGHTDDVGDAEGNKMLSQRRADAVRQALIERFSADGARLSAKGYGEERPRADNGTDEGRARNRRVVATFSAVSE